MSIKRTRRNARACDHCHRWDKTIISSSHLCTDCKALGYRWCSSGKHVVREADYQASRYACMACRRDETRRQHAAKRGVAADPPPGFIPLAEVARRVGYSRSQVTERIHQGWMAGHTWRRGGAGSFWYIRDMASYPLWEDKRLLCKNERIGALDSKPYGEPISASSIGL